MRFVNISWEEFLYVFGETRKEESKSNSTHLRLMLLLLLNNGSQFFVPMKTIIGSILEAKKREGSVELMWLLF